jgi:hypothetical protein
MFFILENISRLDLKTNVTYVVQNVTELFNEEQGRGVIRIEV